MARTPASIKKAHQSLALINPLADVMANPKLNAAATAAQKVKVDKARKQAKNRKAQTARAQRAGRGEVCA